MLTYAGQTITGYRSAYGPSGNLRLASPVLSWKVWAAKGCEISSTSMQVDDHEVAAQYNASTELLTYKPNYSFSIGEHHVECTAMVNGLLKLHQEWDFNVMNDAISQLPPPNPNSSRLLEDINQYRSLLGLEPVQGNPQLIAAAQAHSNYLSDDNTYGHYEMQNISSFVGQTPADRLNAFGWVNGGFEDVGYEPDKSADDTIRALFDAPYHRIPFMQPGTVQVGVGAMNHRTTIEFSFSNGSGVEVSPSNGQMNVPSSWDGNESPNPLRNYGVSGLVGYPIVVAGFGVNFQVKSGKFELYDSTGAGIDCYVNTPNNDSHLDSQIVAIPQVPLINGTYQATATLYFANDTMKTITWSFTVGSQPPLLSLMISNAHLMARISSFDFLHKWQLGE